MRFQTRITLASLCQITQHGAIALRLALPFPGMGYFGFKIESSMLARPGQPNDANELVVGTPANDDPVLGNIPATREAPDESLPSEKPAVVGGDSEEPPATAEAVPAKEEGEVFGDLQRSIEEEAEKGENPPVGEAASP